jgi:hypothetical protein
VTNFSRGATTLQLVSNRVEIDQEDPRYGALLTKDFGKLRLKFSSNGDVSLWVTQFQKEALSQSFQSPASASSGMGLTGSWELEMAFPARGVIEMVMGQMRIVQTGAKFAGSINGRPVTGTINGMKITFAINFEASIPNGIDVTYIGTLVNRTTMRGAVTHPAFGRGTWTATR